MRAAIATYYDVDDIEWVCYAFDGGCWVKSGPEDFDVGYDQGLELYRVMRFVYGVFRRVSGVKAPIVSVNRPIKNLGFDNFRSNSAKGILRRLAERGIPAIIYEPTLNASDFFTETRSRTTWMTSRSEAISLSRTDGAKSWPMLPRKFTHAIYLGETRGSQFRRVMP